MKGCKLDVCEFDFVKRHINYHKAKLWLYKPNINKVLEI